MDDEPTCTFCGAKRSQVEKMVTNDNGAFICDACVMQALRLIVYAQARDEVESNEGS